jgi:tol-pal system protein YbgF
MSEAMISIMLQLKLTSYFILFSLLFIFTHTAYAAQKRIALVIGNSAYKDSPLINPINDARDMSSQLTSLGFTVDTVINANHRQMTKAIQRFGKKLRDKNTVGLFYFAGHGVQVNGSNFLLPVSYNIETEADIEFEAVNAARVLSQMEGAENNLNLMILDACRNNPFTRSFRSASRGLAKMHAPAGSMILYATSPGNVAADGDGKNGLFTSKLLENMSKKGLKIEDVFKKTALEVSRESGKKQFPYIEGYILGDFYFTGPLIIHQSPVNPTTPEKNLISQAETRFWESVEADPGKEMYEAYLQAYPDGHYLSIAKIKLKKYNHDFPLEESTSQNEFQSEKEAYQKSFKLLTKGEYKQAQQSFKTILKMYPNGNLTDRIHYWLGETYYITGNFVQAKKEFQLVLKHALSSKKPDAMFKLGYIYNELGDLQDAAGIFQELTTRYPESTAAKLAKANLEKIPKSLIKTASHTDQDIKRPTYQAQILFNNKKNQYALSIKVPKKEPQIILVSKSRIHSAVLSSDDKYVAYIENHKDYEKFQFQRILTGQRTGMVNNFGTGKLLYSDKKNKFQYLSLNGKLHDLYPNN